MRRYISNDQDWEQVDDEDCWGVNYTEPTAQIRGKIETIPHIWGEEQPETEQDEITKLIPERERFSVPHASRDPKILKDMNLENEDFFELIKNPPEVGAIRIFEQPELWDSTIDLTQAVTTQVHLRPHGQLILISVNSLLVLYFPVIFFIPLIPCLKISFFLPISLLSSRMFCFRFSFSIRLLAFPISTVRRALHLSCCLTSFWKAGRRCRNPSPCMALLVAPLILSLDCRGAVSVSAAVKREILFRSFPRKNAER